MPTNDLTLKQVLSSLPKNGTNAYRLSEFGQVADKIVSYRKTGSGYVFYDKKNQAVMQCFSNPSEKNPKRFDLSLFINGNNAHLIDFDGDGNYDEVFKYCPRLKSRNEYISTKDNDVYDELRFNVNDEENKDGLLIYHTMRGRF